MAVDDEARGHDVMRCRVEDVVGADDMIDMRALRIEPDALYAHVGREDHHMAWDDVAVRLRAIHRTSAETDRAVSLNHWSLLRSAA